MTIMSNSRHSSGRVRKRARLSPLTVIGEVLFVSGLIVVGYIVWQPWYTTTVVAGEQVKISAQYSSQLSAQGASAPAEPGGVAVTPVVTENDAFGVIYIPSFAPDFANVIAEGTSVQGVLNPADKGVGRYMKSQPLGEVGNTAFAAHRSGSHTTPFRDIMKLRVNDPIYIKSAEGWYTYRFRSLEYVLPNESDVLYPFPRLEGVPGVDRILTLTTCHPENWSTAERAIAYSVLEDFRPLSDGPPPDLVKVNPAVQEA